MLIALLVVLPLLVSDCKVAVLHTRTSPVEVLTAVSVPANKLSTPVFVNVRVPEFPVITPPPDNPVPVLI